MSRMRTGGTGGTQVAQKNGLFYAWIGAVCYLCYLCYLYSNNIERVVGVGGIG